MGERHREIIYDDIISFYQWRDEQDFFYQRLDSEVVDYVNSVVNYDEVDSVIADDAVDEIEWSEMFHQFSISEDSDTAQILRDHLESYIDTQQ